MSLSTGGDVHLAVRRAGDSPDAFEEIVSNIGLDQDDRGPDGAGLSIRDILALGLPQAGMPSEVNRWRRSNIKNLARGAYRALLARKLEVPTMTGSLFLGLKRSDGQLVPLGLASMRVVTTVGANAIAGAFHNTGDPLNAYRYHAIGEGNTGGENVGDTALESEVETRDNAGPHGAGGSPNIFQTVGNFTASGTRAVVEHGLFTAATVGDLLDRSEFAVVNLNNLDTLATTYELTVNAGG